MGRSVSRRQILYALPLLAAACTARTPDRPEVDAAKSASLQAAIDHAPDGALIVSSSPKTYASAVIRSRNNLTIRGLQLNSRLTLADCTEVAVEDCEFSGTENGVVMTSCTRVAIRNNSFTAVAIKSEGSADCEFVGNTITQAPGRAIESVGTAARVASGNTFANNTVHNMGETAIYVSGPGSTIEGNRVSSTVFLGTAIALFGWPSNGFAPRTVVSDNVIDSTNTGIMLSSNTSAPLQAVSVSANTLTDCAEFALSAAKAEAAAEIEFVDNTMTFSMPAEKLRIGIQTGSGILFRRNKISYTPTSQGPATDMPMHLVGNNVTLADNYVDGGGRTWAQGLAPAWAVLPEGSYRGWKFLGNKFVNGAMNAKWGTVADVDTDGGAVIDPQLLPLMLQTFGSAGVPGP